ncbi:MAG: molybdopterin molybdotransferase MoeA [Candidatus Mcinerneyibacterium aminivorans]|uniref:Molybdopterin molybdenumtransferase n=1 Tax=Candidatus Mcinerneyibacterium aminivorans TaxID=2703815 RepID=A0A5D0MJX7_9BACT|nr:MAG: molybdopterin molybdotransferase MoeA [Candidatus Mcinerneyibacterium aminivorans]
MMNYNKAIDIIENLNLEYGKERVSIVNANNRVLAEDIKSDIDMPLFDKSAMDGIALKYEDLNNSKKFRVVDNIAAGEFKDIDLEQNECVEIMTGAPVPSSCDTVIRREYIGNYGKKEITVEREEKKGSNIAYKGEDFKKGDILLKEGEYLNEFSVGTIATAGRMYVKVYQNPKIKFYATGDEVYEPDDILPKSGIRNSNAYSVLSFFNKRNITHCYGGIIKDTKEKIKKELDRATKENDIVILSGGVSAGEYDYIPEIVEELGFDTVWHKIAMKPGKPQLFAKKGNKLIFGLPGNPVSTILSLYVFVLPIIKKITGFKKIWEHKYYGKLEGRSKRKAKRYHFVPAKVEKINGEYKLKTVITNGSGDIRGASLADAYMVIPPETKKFNKDRVEFFFVK